MNEFVVFDQNGKEIEWIDPVEEFSESETHWIVHNGIFEYDIEKKSGHTFVIRTIRS